MAPDGWASSQTIPDWLVSWMIYEYLVGGFSPPLWKMMEFVSWDDYSQYMEQLNMFQTTNRKIMRNPPSGNLTCRFNHESQLGWWHSQYMESHIKFMFQTTNQLWPLWFSWLLASLISIFCVNKSHVLCCIHWHSTTRKIFGLETHQTWLCTNISGLTPVSREPLIAPLIHSR